MHARQRRWQERNPERFKELSRAGKRRYYAKHKESSIARSASWLRANPEKRKAIRRRFYENHVAKIALATRRYYAHRDKATPPWAIQFFMDEAYRLARQRTKMLGYKWVVDHIVPLNSPIVCGLHAHTNLQVIPHITNAIKSNKVWPDMAEA